MGGRMRSSVRGLATGSQAIRADTIQAASSRNEPAWLERNVSTTGGRWVSTSTTLICSPAIHGVVTSAIDPASGAGDDALGHPSGVPSSSSGAAPKV